MKQLLFLLLFPCLAMAQYPGNAGQKITLGEQTTADGLVWRGLAADTTRKPSVDTMAYILLDTNTNIIWQYKKAVNNAWRRLNLLPSDTTSFNYVNTYGTQTVDGAKTFTSAITGARFNPTASTLTGTGMFLPSANTLGFSTNNTNRLQINSNGFVGIGTTSHTSRLEVNGSGFFTSRSVPTAGAGLEIYYNGNGNLLAYDRTNEVYKAFFLDGLNYRWNCSGNVVMVMDANSNIGVGQTTTSARLHITAGTANSGRAPLKFTSGTNLTTVEAGAMEFNGTNLFFSPSTTRHTVNHGLTGTATLNFPSTTTLLSADLTITVTGAADGDVVSLGVPNAAVNANTSYSAWVSAANTVTVRFNNYSSGTVDPASGTFKVFVTK